MNDDITSPLPLTERDVETFVTQGCVPGTWTSPVIRLDQFTQPVFREAANTPRQHAAPARRLRPAGRNRTMAAPGLVGHVARPVPQ